MICRINDFRDKDIVIPWEEIEVIGEDTILVRRNPDKMLP